jgi:hypothetical protein
MTARPTGSQRQIALFEEVGDLAEMVRRLALRSRLSPIPGGWSPAEPLAGFDAKARGWSAMPLRPPLPPGVPMI